MNIVRKDITHSKLTIAKDRIELKFPLNIEKPQEDAIISLANQVVNEMGVVTQTIRGEFFFNNRNRKWNIKMFKGTATNKVPRTLVKSFEG
jgi:hypothetical protein